MQWHFPNSWWIVFLINLKIYCLHQPYDTPHVAVMWSWNNKGTQSIEGFMNLRISAFQQVPLDFIIGLVQFWRQLDIPDVIDIMTVSWSLFTGPSILLEFKTTWHMNTGIKSRRVFNAWNPWVAIASSLACQIWYQIDQPMSCVGELHRVVYLLFLKFQLRAH